MPDFSKPLELSFVFGTIVVIFIVIGIGIYFVKKYAVGKS
jgi:flagellar biogenesis protein FliO